MLNSIPASGNRITPAGFYPVAKKVILAGAGIVLVPDETGRTLTVTAPGVDGAAATATWGEIGGSITAQADLEAALSAKADTSALTAKADLSGAYFSGTIGYTSSAWGSATQLTSKSTAVTINAPSGQITMNTAAMNTGVVVSFTVNNSTVDTDDVVVVNLKGGASNGNNYRYWVNHDLPGGFAISVENRSAVTLSEALVFNFAVIKANQ